MEKIEKRFIKLRHQASQLENKEASLFRKNYFEYLKRQATNRIGKGRHNSSGTKEMSNGRSAIVPPPLNLPHKIDRQENDEENKKNNTLATFPASEPDFEEFWLAYGQNTGKPVNDGDRQQALHAWSSLDVESRVAAFRFISELVGAGTYSRPEMYPSPQSYPR